MQRARLPLIFLSICVTQGAFGFVIDPSYAGGFVGSANSPNGDSLVLNAPPTDVLSTDSAANACAGLLTGFGYTVFRGSSISGTLTIDDYEALVSGSPGNPYFMGIAFDSRLNSTETFTATANRWVFYQHRFVNNQWTYSDLSYEGNGPFHYNALDEAYNTNGSDAFGPYGKRFAARFTERFGNQYSGPWPVINDSYAFMVDVSGNNLTIREGVHFGFTGTEAPVPEPCSLFALTSGCWIFLRKRRASWPG
ncbi:MAG: hypothetical protein ACHQ50_10675 [Fimbriimonadales bacterium]